MTDMSSDKIEAEPPAVVGVAAEQARLARDRYRLLGPISWAEAEAERDSSSSIRCLSLFARVHGLNFDESDLVNETRFYTDLWISGLFIPLAKYVTSFYLATMSGLTKADGTTVYRDLPKRPDWLPAMVEKNPIALLFPSSPRVSKILRTRLNEKRSDGAPRRRALDLAWSFLGLKSAFPPMWVDKIADSLRDHAALLSSQPPPLENGLRTILRSIARTVAHQAYRPYRRPGDVIVKYDRLPRARLSSSAGWVKMFDKDARRWVSMQGTRSAQYQELSGLAGPLSEELFSMAFTPRAGVQEFRQHPYQFHWSDWDYDPKVSVVALQEPFKIRTISISDGPTTAASSPFQRAWHDVLRSLGPFRLVGGQRVADIVGQFTFNGTPFVSGDYSAATDRLSLNASRVVLETLLQDVALPGELRRRIESSLLGSVLEYKDTLNMFKDKIPSEIFRSIGLPPTTPQTNGQLMGNILSFPILCIVNLAGFLYMVARSPDHPLHESLMEQLGPFWQDDSPEDSYAASSLSWESTVDSRPPGLTLDFLDNLPVLVNGDDILFQATPDQYDIWLQVIGSLGFKPSQGKNYYSPHFFTINSELYTSDGFRSRPWWGAFQSDLVRLRQELKFELGEDVLQCDLRRVLPSMQAFLRETISPERWPSVNSTWVRHLHDSSILEPYRGLNWFLPVSLGGLGLDPSGHTVRTTYAQRKLAVRLGLQPLGAPPLASVDGSLTSARNTGRLKKIHDTWSIVGETVRVSQGPHRGTHVLDKENPLVVRWRGTKSQVYLRCYTTWQTLQNRTPHMDLWYDHHLSGVRLEGERVSRSVTRLLSWGLGISDRHLSLFDSLDPKPRHECSTQSRLIPVSAIDPPRT